MTSPTDIKFTVIIPTRSRPETLRWALKSCVEQNYDHLEIIVCDNFSQDHTPEVVAEYRDSRIKYINPQQRLGMAENWEFSLQHATGDYVNYIGDDDAMLPRAFCRLNTVIQELGCDALSWVKDDFVYFWPQTELANLLSIGLWGSPDVQKIHSRQFLSDLQSFKQNYELSPMVYSGVVRRTVLQKIASYGGQFFRATSPDVYSGIAVACELEYFYRSGTPYSMTGSSKHSTGASVLYGQSTNPQPSREFHAENTLAPHSSLGAPPVNIEMCVADSILIARDTIPRAADLAIDLTVLMTSIARNAQPLNEERYQNHLHALQEIAQRNQLQSLADQLIAKFPHRPALSGNNQLIEQVNANANAIGAAAYFNCADFGIDNVYDASILTDHILSMHRNGCFSWRFQVHKFLKSLGLLESSKNKSFFWKTM